MISSLPNDLLEYAEGLRREETSGSYEDKPSKTGVLV